MSIEMLRNILSKTANKELNPMESSLTLGKEFPYQLLNVDKPFSNVLLCFVSLSCEICVDLISELKEYDENMKRFFVLITDGDTEENEEIARYYNFNFDILSFQDDYGKLNIPSTPYMFNLDGNNIVIDGLTIDSLSDVKELISKKLGESMDDQ